MQCNPSFFAQRHSYSSYTSIDKNVIFETFVKTSKPKSLLTCFFCYYSITDNLEIIWNHLNIANFHAISHRHKPHSVCIMRFMPIWNGMEVHYVQMVSKPFNPISFLFSLSIGLKSFHTVFCKYTLRLIMSLSKNLKDKYKEMIYECCPCSTVLSHLEIPKSITKNHNIIHRIERGWEDIGVVYRRNNLPLGVWCVWLHPGCRCTIC